MSWMDSCARRANTAKAGSSEVKYCSDKCKKNKPKTAPDSIDVKAEAALTALLQGHPLPGSSDEANAGGKAKHKPKKGDPRIIVQLSEVELAVFGDRSDPEKTYGRRKNRRARFVPDDGEWKSVDMEEPAPSVTAEDDDNDTAASLTDGSLDEGEGGVRINDHIRAPQSASEVNFSVGGERGWSEKIDETPEMLAKRREGQKRADEKELVKAVARRAVVFGLLMDAEVERGKRKGRGGDEQVEAGGKVRRKCEALMNGLVVEPSFAKGDWSVRWRED